MLPNPAAVATTEQVTTPIRWTRPPVDLRQTEDGSLVALLDVPGVTRDALTLEVQDGTLTVTAKRSEARGYRWALELPDLVDPDRTEARLDSGVLEVTLRRVPKPEPRRITVA
jgi:HSP20 family molecular chaperone IbpA